MLPALLCAAMLAADPLPVPAPPPAECPAPVCCTVETTVKVPRTVYATKDTEYCPTGRSLLLMLQGHCDDAIRCGPVRVKHQLVIKTVTDEKCEAKCVAPPKTK